MLGTGTVFLNWQQLDYWHCCWIPHPGPATQKVRRADVKVDPLLVRGVALLLIFFPSCSEMEFCCVGDTSAAEAAAELRAFASSTPALATAVRRLIMRRNTENEVINGDLKKNSGPAGDKQLVAAIQMATAALLHTLPQGQDSAAAGQPETAGGKLPEDGAAAGRQSGAGAAAAPHARPKLPGAPAAALNIAAYLLTTPLLIEGTPPAVRMQLTSLTAFPAVLAALGVLSSMPGTAQQGGTHCSYAPDARRINGATIR